MDLELFSFFYMWQLLLYIFNWLCKHWDLKDFLMSSQSCAYNKNSSPKLKKKINKILGVIFWLIFFCYACRYCFFHVWGFCVIWGFLNSASLLQNYTDKDNVEITMSNNPVNSDLWRVNIEEWTLKSEHWKVNICSTWQLLKPAYFNKNHRHGTFSKDILKRDIEHKTLSVGQDC